MRPHLDSEQERCGDGSAQVLVIGAGVSGCACASTLAAGGVRVTVMGAALDRTGLPRSGPVLASGCDSVDRAQEVLESLPGELRQAWWRSAFWPEDRSFVAVDRRLVSIETKRALEQMPGLQFRQGVVCDVRPLARCEMEEGDPRKGSLAAQSVFGEMLSAEAIVVAVGQGLGKEGGADGGSHGDVGKHRARTLGLREALEAMGGRLSPTKWEVDARVKGRAAGGSSASEWEIVRESLSLGGETGSAPVLRKVGRGGTGARPSSEKRDSVHVSQGVGCWPESPYDGEGLWATEALVARRQDGRMVLVGCADGVATGEISVAAVAGKGRWDSEGREEGAGSSGELVITRLRREEEGLVVVGLDEGGRLRVCERGGGAVWVTGRAAGAKDYLESLAGGVRTGLLVAESLR